MSLYPDDDFTMLTRRPPIGEGDALMLRSSDGRRLYVVPRYFDDGDLTTGALASVINTYLPDLRLGAVLVIVSNVPLRGSEGSSLVTFGLPNLGKIVVAIWNGPGDTPELQRALRSAIAVGDESREPQDRGSRPSASG